MKIVQKFLAIMALVIAFLAIMIMPARSAVVVSDISDTQFNTLISGNAAAWSVVYRGGGGDEEIRLARNIATPQSGGGANTLIGNLTWSTTNNSLEILVDGAGNISARANAVTVGTWAITQPFNQLLVRVFDNNAFGTSDLQSISTNGSTVRNMFADGSGPTVANDIISITDFGSQAPFSFNGVWSPGIAPVSDQQYVWIVALNNTSIPEPSALLLTGCSCLLLIRRKR